MDYAKKIILAIDETSIDRIRTIVKATSKYISTYKLGSIPFTAHGPIPVREIIDMGKDVFLDLKYFDIPNTVSKAVEQAINLGVRMITLHAMGGEEMLKRAVEVNSGRSMLFAVTILTSMENSQLSIIGMNGDVKDMVVGLAKMAVNTGIDGIIASGRETSLLRESFGRKPVIVVPGVRMDNNSRNDQKRVVTPRIAFESGADYIVIGRPVTESRYPEKVLEEIIQSCELYK